MNPINFLELIGRGVVPPVLVATWLVMAVLLLVAIAARGALARAADPMVPDSRITLLSVTEAAVDGLREFVKSLLGEHRLDSYVRFFGTLFIFILAGNLLGLIPGMSPATSDTDLTWALALFPFFYYFYIGFSEQGPGYLKSFLGPMRSAPYIPLMILMLVIEVVDNLARPFSLGIRLFANMFADHHVLNLFTSMTYIGVPVLLYMLGLLVCVVQAFVFVLLSMIYVLMASHEH